MKNLQRWSLLFALMVSILAISPVRAAGLIVLDSLFNDWVGQAYVTDPSGDGNNGTDFTKFYFATNPGVSTLFFMLERLPSDQQIIIWQSFDMNNNGIFNEPEDRLVQVTYEPKKNNSKVDVTVYTGTNQFIAQIANNTDYGESKNEGGKKVEWGVPMGLLGMTPGQTINIGLTVAPEENEGGAISDSLNTPVQWSPANALGWALLGLILAAAVFWMARLRQRQDKMGA